MKNIYKNLVNGSLLGAALLLGATACSDDHFDVMEQPGGGNGSHTTIWQCIKANPNLSDVAEVLEATRVMKDDKDSKATLTYSEWLDQPMSVTAWLPKNGSFDKDYYLNMIAEAQAMGNDTLANNDFAALRLEYQVVNQFVKNHIALFNYGNTAVKQEVRLLNSKLCDFDAQKRLFNTSVIADTTVQHTSNGALYVLETPSEFAHNIFDLMSSDSTLSIVYGIISDPKIDKNTFWPEGSTQGAMNEKGEIVYVDSVYTNNNELLNRAHALIKSEDSIYVAMIPTNLAWDETFNAVKPLFAYGKVYSYDWQDGRFVKSGWKINADSLQIESTRAAIIESMFFNPTTFARENGTVSIDKKNRDEVIHFMLFEADSLISTNGTVYYNENAGTGLANPMFDGVDIKPASNGFVFVPNNNRIKPEYSFIPRRIFRPSSALASLSGCKSDNGERLYLTVDTRQTDSIGDFAPVVGDVEDHSYDYYEMDGLSTLKLRLRLSNLPCGHYKISAQMLPNRINKNTVDYEDDGITPIAQTPLFTAEMFDDQGILDRTRNITVNQDSVSNVVLFEDFHLKKSYMNLPAGYETFPSIELSIKSSQMLQSNCKALSIAKIIVEPIRK